MPWQVGCRMPILRGNLWSTYDTVATEISSKKSMNWGEEGAAMNSVFIRLATLLIAVAITGCGGGGGGAGGPTSQPATNSFTGAPLDCGNYNKVRQGDYVASTSPWGVTGDMAPTTVDGKIVPSTFTFTDCVGIASNPPGVQFNSKWNIPSQLTYVIYPEIIFGLKGGFTAANSQLPRAIADVKSMVVTWDYDLVNNGNMGDVLLESWLTSTATPSGLAPYQGTMVELAIILERFGGWISNASSFPVVTIGGRQYYMELGNSPNGSVQAPTNAYSAPAFQFHAFFYPVALLGRTANLDVKQFADYLITNRIIPAGLFFSDVEFGNEIALGAGELKMRNFSVNVQ